MVGKSVCSWSFPGRGMNWMMSALTAVPPISRLQSGRSARAISDTRSSASLWNEMRGMIAKVQSFRARTVSLLQGPLAAVASAPRRALARSRVPASDDVKGSDGGTPRDAPGDGRWELRRRDMRPPSDWRISTKKPAADFSARALHDFRDDDNLPVICPTCQMFLRSKPEDFGLRNYRCWAASKSASSPPGGGTD